MAEVTTVEHPDGSVTTTVVEAGRRFETTVSPHEAATIALSLLSNSAAARIAGCFGVGARSGFDVSGAAEWAWQDPNVRAGKRESDTQARDRWWQGLGSDRRQGVRVNFLVFKHDAPKVSRAEQNKWWDRLGKDRRERLRDKYRAGDFLSDVVDVVTLSPVLSKIPIIKDIHRATVSLHSAPFDALKRVAKGERIDKAALGSFKQQLAAAKTLGPYAQTVVSMVPGIGTGVSAALGAGLALAEGKPLDQAVLAGVRGALPGGAVAQMAFDAATAVMAGKPIDQVALAALPIDATAKKALIEGAKIARAAASGKRIDQAVLDSALTMLPKDVQRAAQVAVAVGSGALAQKGLGPLVNAIPASVVRGTSTSKALELAAKSLAGATGGKLAATAKLNLGAIATQLGAPDSAAKLVQAAKRAAPNGQVLTMANAARKRLLASNAAPSASELAALARSGRVRSSAGGAVTPAQLAQAAASGRIFYVER